MINLSYHLEWKKCGSNKQMITSKILGQRTWKCVMKYVFAGAPCISLLLPRNHEKCYMAAASVVHWISMCPAPTFSHLLAFGKWTVDLALWTKANGLRAALVCSLWAEAFEPMQDPPGFTSLAMGILQHDGATGQKDRIHTENTCINVRNLEMQEWCPSCIRFCGISQSF